MTTIPMVLDARDGRGYDIFSRLLRDRIVLLSGPVTEEQAASVIAQLLFLEAEDPGKDVSLHQLSRRTGHGGACHSGYHAPHLL